MFDKITKTSQDYLQKQIDELKSYCDKDPDVAEMVRYIIAYSDQMAYCGGDEDAKIGRQIIQHIWEIDGMGLSSLGNSFHFDPSWASNLNNFIGNYVYDDSAFDFTIDERSGTIDFKGANYEGRWLQNPRIIVEAAKANRAYYSAMDNANIYTRRDVPKADASQVLELVK